MEVRSADVVVLGAGSAGLSAFHAARKSSKKVLLVDPGPLGTKCARTGCMPSKLLLAASHAALAARRASHLGVHAEPEIDGRAVLERVRSERDHFVGSVKASLPDELVRGTATFEGPRTIRVSDDLRLEADAFVVATGADPYVPPPLRGLGALGRTHQDIFELDRLPARLAVVGMGPIGLELASAFAGLGVEVTGLHLPPVLDVVSDPDVRASLESITREALDLRLGCVVREARTTGSRVELSFETKSGSAATWQGDMVLVATGITPRVDGLNLAAAGVPIVEGKPQVNLESLRGGESRVYFAGDVLGERPLLHEAIDEGRTAGRNAAACREDLALLRRARLEILFTEPAVARVGLSYEDIDKNRCCIGRVDFASQGRARVEHRNRGRLHVYAERATGALLGAELVAPAGEHLAHLLAFAVERRLRVDEVLDLPFYHPTLEEGLRTALRHAWEACHQMRPADDIFDCGVGS